MTIEQTSKLADIVMRNVSDTGLADIPVIFAERVKPYLDVFYRYMV